MKPAWKSFRRTAGVCAMLCLGSVAAAAAQESLRAFGLTHRALGQARISLHRDGGLVVANLGTSGGDGVSADLGELQGFLPEAAFADGVPNGATVTAAVRGRVDGLADQPAGSLALRGTAQGVEIVPDFSPLGARSYRLRVYDGGRLVVEQDGLAPDARTRISRAASQKGKWCFGILRISYHFGRSRVVLPNGGEAFGDAVYLFQEGATRTIQSYTTGTLVAAGLAGFTVTDEELKVFHLHHRAIGDAIVKSQGGELTVSAPNRKARRSYGVSVDANLASAWHAVLAALDTRSLPTGATLLAETAGTVAGTPDQPVVATRIRDVGTQLEVSFDFSSLGIGSYTVQALRAGVVVDEVPGVIGPGGRISVLGCIVDPRLDPERGLVASVGSPTPTTIVLTGRAPVIGDQIRAFPDPGTAPAAVSAFSRFQLTATEIPSFLVKGEEVTPELFNGLEQQALDGASLSEGNFRLAVAGDPALGQTGSIFRTGEVDGVLWTIDLGEEALRPGFVFDARSFGSIDGVPDQPAGGLRTERVPQGFLLTPDFSTIGAQTYELQLYLENRLVFSRPGMSGPAALIAAEAGARRYCCRVIAYSCAFGSTGSHARDVAVINGPTVKADLLIFKHEGATRSLDFHSAISSVAQGASGFSLAEEWILLFGLTPHRALGRATLDAREGRLTVGNIGTSGEDGVDVEVGHFAPAESAVLSWEPIDPEDTAPAGAFLQINTVGSFDGVPNRPLGELRVTKRQGGGARRFEITANFADIRSPTQHLHVWANGTLVADLPGHGGPVGSASAWPRSLGKLGGATECIVAHYDDGTRFRIDNRFYHGDELRVLAEGQSGKVDFKSDLAIRAAGLPGITFTGEQIVPQTTPLP
jgi:hypothetical protein